MVLWWYLLHGHSKRLNLSFIFTPKCVCFRHVTCDTLLFVQYVVCFCFFFLLVRVFNFALQVPQLGIVHPPPPPTNLRETYI